jgi:hypothetical protein
MEVDGWLPKITGIDQNHHAVKKMGEPHTD